MTEPFYVGIGVCSHDQDVVEKAVFSNVEIAALPVKVAAKLSPTTLYSVLETVPIDSGDRTAVYFSAGRFEAPNWTRDGKAFLFNHDGKILRLVLSGGKPETIDTDLLTTVTTTMEFRRTVRCWRSATNRSRSTNPSFMCCR